MNVEEDTKCPICDSITVASRYTKLFDDRFGHPSQVDIYKCTDCKHFYCLPSLEKASVGELYRNYYGRSSTTTLGEHKSLRSALRRWVMGEGNVGQYVLHPEVRNRLLDVGSGDCQNLWDAVQLGFDAVGFDVDTTSSEIGSANGLIVRAGESVRAAYPDEQFDFIQMNQVIEHYVDPVEQLMVLTSSLEKDGQIFISTPNCSSIYRRVFGRRWINWHVPYHQHHFSKRSIRQLLTSNGWRIDSMRTVTPIIWFWLQLRRCRDTPVRGTPSLAWIKPASRSEMVLYGLLTAIMFIPIRICDFLKMGDSFAIVASRRK